MLRSNIMLVKFFADRQGLAQDLVYDVMDYTGVPYDDLTPREVLQSILGVFDCKTFYELPKPIRKRIVIVVIRVLVKRKQK